MGREVVRFIWIQGHDLRLKVAEEALVAWLLLLFLALLEIVEFLPIDLNIERAADIA